EPSRMFSSTLSLESTLVSWKVRTMPIRATLNAPTPLSDVPLNDQSPWSGWSKPVSRLKNVVLPAPLGPIKAVMTPRWISRCSTSTAVRPPKVRRIPCTATTGSGLAAPGSCGTDCRSVGIERDLPSITEDALRPVDHQQHQHQADQHQPDGRCLVGVHELRHDRVARQLRQDRSKERQDRPEHHR